MINEEIVKKIIAGDYDNRHSPNQNFNSYFKHDYYDKNSNKIYIDLNDFENIRENKEGKIRNVLKRKDKYIGTGTYGKEQVLFINDLIDMPLIEDERYLSGILEDLNKALKMITLKDPDDDRIEILSYKIKSVEQYMSDMKIKDNMGHEILVEKKIMQKYNEIFNRKIPDKEYYFKDDYKYGKSLYKYLFHLINVCIDLDAITVEIKELEKEYGVNLVLKSIYDNITNHMLERMYGRLVRYYNEFYDSVLLMFDTNIPDYSYFEKAVAELTVIYNYMIYDIRMSSELTTPLRLPFDIYYYNEKNREKVKNYIENNKFAYERLEDSENLLNYYKKEMIEGRDVLINYNNYLNIVKYVENIIDEPYSMNEKVFKLRESILNNVKVEKNRLEYIIEDLNRDLHIITLEKELKDLLFKYITTSFFDNHNLIADLFDHKINIKVLKDADVVISNRIKKEDIMGDFDRMFNISRHSELFPGYKDIIDVSEGLILKALRLFHNK